MRIIVDLNKKLKHWAIMKKTISQFSQQILVVYECNFTDAVSNEI
jgi:hypothetical protein